MYRTESIDLLKNQSTNIGDVVTFGKYPIRRARKLLVPIEWTVLDKQDNKILVISRYGIDCQQYNTEIDESVTWETCSLRWWLNNTFYSRAFSCEEQSMIINSTVTADKNPRNRTRPGKDTIDKIFLLSIAEAKKYFSSDKDRICKPTAYVKEGNIFCKIGNHCWWWLRTPGINQLYAAIIDQGGRIAYDGRDAYDDGDLFFHSSTTGDISRKTCVRPAMWINLEPNSSSEEKDMHKTKDTTNPLDVDGTKSAEQAEKQVSDIDLLKRSSTNIGDAITFGEYPATEDGKLAPIEWNVLDKQDNKILVISKYGLDCQQYNTKNRAVTWNTCSLRRWLNNDFLTSAFSSGEQSIIVNSKITVEKNRQYTPKDDGSEFSDPDDDPYFSYDAAPADDTIDKIFLLSTKEAKKYFRSDDDRDCEPTEYALENAPFATFAGSCGWWLRTSGFSRYDAACVVGGEIIYGGHSVNESFFNICIRPAMWLNLKPNGSDEEKDIHETKNTTNSLDVDGTKPAEQAEKQASDTLWKPDKVEIAAEKLYTDLFGKFDPEKYIEDMSDETFEVLYTEDGREVAYYNNGRRRRAIYVDDLTRLSIDEIDELEELYSDM